MYFTIKQQVKHLSKAQYCILRELCHTAKNLANQAIYNVRQHYFEHGTYLTYKENYHLLKTSEHYQLLNANMAQQILKEVDGSFQSFFGLLKTKQNGTYQRQVKLPQYLEKDGFTTLVIGFVRVKEDSWVLPYSNAYRKTHERISFSLPPVLKGKTIKEIRIIPKYHGLFFELQYTYEVACELQELNPNRVLALDPGVSNLVTGATNTGETFLIDGKKLKSINQWYNKQMARIQSIKDKQGYSKKYSKLQSRITLHRNHRVNDYLNKVARYLINYCLTNQIGILVFGYKEDFQTNHPIHPKPHFLMKMRFQSIQQKIKGNTPFVGNEFTVDCMRQALAIGSIQM